MNQVLTIIARHTRPVLSVEALQRHHMLTDIGIDSLGFLMVLLDLQDMPGGASFTAEQMVHVRTVGDILDIYAPTIEAPE